MNFSNLTIQEVNHMYKEGQTTLNELSSKFFDRAKNIQDKYNAFITLDSDYYNNVVEDISEELGEDHSLAGIPAVLGDNICTKNLRTTCGSKIMENYISPFNAQVVDKLLEAGVIISGKGNIDEFGAGDSKGSSYYGHSKNPWNEKITPGNGAACAIASGTALFGLASDASGNLRQSAAYCGIAGLKPTYGRVSRYGLIDYAPSLDQIGILAKNARDIALVLACTAGKDSRDVTSLDNPVPKYINEIQGQLEGLKVGIVKNWEEASSLENEVKKSFQKEIETLKEKGVKIIEVDIPSLFHSSTVTAIIGAVEAFSNLANFDGVRFGCRAESKHLHEMYIKTRTEGLGTYLKRFLTFGAMASSEKHFNSLFLTAQKMRTKIIKELQKTLEEVDMIATPTVPFQAPSLESSGKEEGITGSADVFTSAANLAGLPAISIPVNIDTSTPTGFQLIGRTFEEGTLLKVLHSLEINKNIQWPTV